MSASGSMESSSTASAAQKKAVAQKLFDVAVDAKISDKSSNYLRTLLEDVSIDFSTYDMSKISYSNRNYDSDCDDLSVSGGDGNAALDSADLSLSDCPNDEDEANKKQLLLKILSFPAPNQRPIAQFQAQNTPQYTDSDVLNTMTIPANYNRTVTESDIPIRGSDVEKLNNEIVRLSDILDDRRTKFRDLVRNGMYSLHLMCKIDFLFCFYHCLLYILISTVSILSHSAISICYQC